MLTRDLRQRKCLSQEQLADMTGLSLRTIQRVESGHSVSDSSLRSLAEFFEINAEAFKQKEYGMAENSEESTSKPNIHLAHHRAAQLIIFVVTFFVCVSQWMAYYSYLNLDPSEASLGTILKYVSEIAFAAAIFAYVFSTAKTTFIWSYYTTAGAFFVVSFGIGYWTKAFVESASYQLLFPVYFSLMLLTLSLIHVLQLAVSLKGETVVVVSQEGDAASRLHAHQSAG